jgi:hypothetical protein
MKSVKDMSEDELKNYILNGTGQGYRDPDTVLRCLEEYVGREVICALMDSVVREKWAKYFKNDI